MTDPLDRTLADLPTEDVDDWRKERIRKRGAPRPSKAEAPGPASSIVLWSPPSSPAWG